MRRQKKKILLVQPRLQPCGGGTAVAVWMIEALKGDYEVSVLTSARPNVDLLNRYYGVSLSPSDFKVYCLPRLVRALLSLDRHGVQELSLLLRICKMVRDKYDLVITADNESDFGGQGIQYVHYPWLHQHEKKWQSVVGRPWAERLWAVVRGRYRPWMILSGYSFERMKKNLTLVNSEWTGRRCKEFYGIETITVYPPVSDGFPEVPWEQRRNGFVCIGRISGEKRLEELIDILSAVRSQGQDIQFLMIGTRTPSSDYYQRVLRRVQENRSWVSLRENADREELIQLVSCHRYGIHGMASEPFGIAVAEMVKAGCIVFAPRGGGPVEIVGPEDRLLYETAEEAVAKIVRVVESPAEQLLLRNYLRARKALFSTEHFVRRIREIVRDFESS